MYFAFYFNHFPLKSSFSWRNVDASHDSAVLAGNAVSIIRMIIHVLAACSCSVDGSVRDVYTCDNATGQCQCKQHVTGRACDVCSDTYWNLTNDNELGCIGTAWRHLYIMLLLEDLPIHVCVRVCTCRCTCIHLDAFIYHQNVTVFLLGLWTRQTCVIRQQDNASVKQTSWALAVTPARYMNIIILEMQL